MKATQVVLELEEERVSTRVMEEDVLVARKTEREVHLERSGIMILANL